MCACAGHRPLSPECAPQPDMYCTFKSSKYERFAFKLKSFLQIPCRFGHGVFKCCLLTASILYYGRSTDYLLRFSRLGVSATRHFLRYDHVRVPRPEDKHWLSVGSSETPALRCETDQHLELLSQIS